MSSIFLGTPPRSLATYSSTGLIQEVLLQGMFLKIVIIFA